MRGNRRWSALRLLTMNVRAVLSPLLATLALAACTLAPAPSPSPSPHATPSPSPSPSPAPTGPAGLDGRQFLSIAVTHDGQTTALVDGTRIRLTFDGGRVGAHAGCNTMGGTYQTSGDNIVVNDLAMTEMGCSPALHAQDTWLASFLTSRPTVALSRNDLTLANDSTTISLLDRAVAEPDQPLVGPTWVLSSIITGEAVSSVPGGVVASLTFAGDGRVAMAPGCNSGGGSFIVDGNTITFGDIVLTDMACGGAAGQVESDVLAVLGAGPVEFGIDADTLTLTAGNIGLQLTAMGDQ